MIARRAFVAGLTLSLGACAETSVYVPFTAEQRYSAEIPGIPDARFPTDAAGRSAWERAAVSAWRRRAGALGSRAINRTETALALSGGGQDGAFGAGLLAGWTKRGDRPEFDYVTGVSAGALIAPFAFLGPSYDAKVANLFTTVDEDALLSKRWPGAALTDDALYDTSPLFHRIEAIVDTDMIAGIAREYRRGRLLLIGTTNIVAARPVFWNIGAIAASGRPEAAGLIHRVLLASAAIPTLFPPVEFQTVSGGVTLRELHVDGSATVGQFLYAPTLRLRALPRPQGPENRIVAYVIRNGRLRPSAKAVRAQALDLAERAVATLTASRGLGDLYREFELAARDRIDINYAAIGDDFTDEPKGLFDRTYMNALFVYGERAGAEGREWAKTAPGFEH